MEQPWLTDLSVFTPPKGRLYLYFARRSPVAVILHRGSGKWWQMIRWETGHDVFERGHWFSGSVYPTKCSISPDGRLFSYFAGKFRARDVGAGYGKNWIAVSRPPYFTALALWPVNTTYGGATSFDDDGTLYIGTRYPHHPDHPPGPLRVVKEGPYRKDLDATAAPPLHGTTPVPGWTGLDQRRRMIATVGARIFEGHQNRKHGLRWRLIADFQLDEPVAVDSPAWAKQWP